MGQIREPCGACWSRPPEGRTSSGRTARTAFNDFDTIYTHVAIKKPKEIHTTTHPGANLQAPRPAAGEDLAEASAGELLSSLAAEPGGEEGEDDAE